MINIIIKADGSLDVRDVGEEKICVVNKMTKEVVTFDKGDNAISFQATFEELAGPKLFQFKN